MPTAVLASKAPTARSYDARVDEKIAQANPSLQPMLNHLRELVHTHVPTATETVKWGMPFFELDGTILANMGIFQHHCAFGFWSKTMTEHLRADGIEPQNGAGSFGKLTTMRDLPPAKQIARYLRTAASHIRTGTAVSPIAFRAKAAANAGSSRGPDGNASAKPPIAVPPDLTAALAKQPSAATYFAKLAPSCRREYLVWITDAKRPETRQRRIARAVSQLAEGKKFGWQYQK